MDSQSLGQFSEQRIQQMVQEEVNSYTKSLSENMKQNFIIQKRDSEGMVKRLGSNIQEALLKIKDEL